MRARFLAIALALAPLAAAVLVDASTHEARAAQPGWLGVSMETSKGKPGVLVMHVTRTSPAEKGGLAMGDRIVSLDGNAVTRPAEVSAPIAAKGAGQSIVLEVARGTKTLKLTVVLAARPSADQIFAMEAVGQKVSIPPTVKVVSGPGPASYPSLDGRVVLVDFFATWCGPCAMLGPYYQALHAKYAAQGLTVLAISDEDPGLLAGWSAKNGVPYTIASDADDAMFATYGAPALPASMIVDKHGVVREVEVGFDPAQVKHVEQVVQALLKEP